MCGVFGFINWKNRDGFSLDSLIKATNLLYHRGPDGGAYTYDPPFFLAHRRLSIIDVTGGAQPMFSSDGRYGIVFNGEIYNYLELKDELKAAGYNFKTNSDTEVLLHGYIHWKENLPKHLIGMFAFAITDFHEKSIFLSKDRLGEKPLFYYKDEHVFCFASELKSLNFLLNDTKSLNKKALSQFFMLNYVPEEHTLFTHIHKLKPGTWMLIGENKNSSGVYWAPQQTEVSHFHSLDAAINNLDAHLEKSVRIACRSDVPITLALSGGIDSSLVGYYAAKMNTLKEAYCVDFQQKGFSEFPQAKIVADQLGIQLNSVPLSSSILEAFIESVYHADDPLADSSGLAVWALAREVSKKYKVMLGGDGGDEVFGGYLTYKASLFYQKLYKWCPDFLLYFMSSISKSISVSSGKVSTSYKLMRFLRAFGLDPNIAHFTWNGTWLPKNLSHLMDNHSMNALNDLHGDGKKDFLTNLQITDLQNYLPYDILTKVDRMTMAHGLESRAPFLHPDIVQFGLNLPSEFKISKKGKLKNILRKLTEVKFGAKIANAKKQGFSIPINDWLRGDAKGLMTDILSEDSLKKIPFLNTHFVHQIMREHLNGQRQYGFELWGLMVFVIWQKQQIVEKFCNIRNINLQEIKRI